MPILTTPSGAFPISLVYITVGTLVDIWAAVSMIYYPPETNWGHFLQVGFLISGFALLAIGLLLGPIGRAVRHAELPPTEVTQAVTTTAETAAANPPPVVPTTAAAPSKGVVPSTSMPGALEVPVAAVPRKVP